MQDSMTNMFAAVRKVEADFKVHMQEVNSLKDKLNEPSDAFITDMQAMQKRLYTENKFLEQQIKTLTSSLSERDEQLTQAKESNDLIAAALAERDRELKDSKEHCNNVHSKKDEEICRLKESIKSLEKSKSKLSDRWEVQYQLDGAKLFEKDSIIQQASNDKVKLERELAEAHEKLKDLEGKTANSDTKCNPRPSVQPFVPQHLRKRQRIGKTGQANSNGSASG